MDETSKLKRTGYLAIASLCFGAALVGAILPGIPTTPFLLLTSYFLTRSSPKLNERLLQSKLFGPILKDWQQRHGVRLDVKIQAMVTVVLMVGVTIWLTRPSQMATLSLIALVGVGLAVIWKLPTISESSVSDDSPTTGPDHPGRT